MGKFKTDLNVDANISFIKSILTVEEKEQGVFPFLVIQ